MLGHGGFRALAYAEWGPPRAEQTVICVHGVSRTGRDFDTLAEALAAKGMRVIAPDLPGRGRSEWLASSSHYTDRAYTAAMSALIARLDVDGVDWIGTSLGGHIGMMMAAQHGSPIKRLVLNDFGARVSATALRRIGGYLAHPWRFATLEELEGHLREALAPFGDLTNDQWRHLATHSAVGDADDGFRFHYDPAISTRFSIPIWLDIVLWQLWEQIECPVLVMRGEHSDLLSVRTVDEMLRRGPSAAKNQVRAVQFDACGHAPALMDSHQISVIADFLRPGSRAADPPQSKRWSTKRSRQTTVSSP